MKPSTTFFIIAVVISLFVSTQSTSDNRLLQTTVRSQTVTTMCATFTDRNSIVDSNAQSDAEKNKAAMLATFQVSGNDFLSPIFNSPNGYLNAAVSAIPTIQTSLGLFAGPFAVGLIILLVAAPFLCCCCCCPSCCPSKCCQKPDTEQYTKCELFWPSITLILALLLLIVASVIGITRASDIQKSYTAVGCSIAITTDDVLYGNTSSAGTYFMGVSNLVNGLNNLKNNLGSVNTQIGKITYSNTSGTLRQAYNRGDNVLSDLSNIPTGTANGVMAAFSYGHFDGTGGGSIPSTFPTILGSGPTSGSGAINATYDVIKQINLGIKAIGDNADTFSGQTGSLTGIIDQAVSSIGSLVDLIKGVDTSIGSSNTTIAPIMNIITAVVTAIFGVFIGLGVLSILGTVLMTFCDKFSCRYLLYFVCFVLFIIGIICFLLALLFSVITPVLYLACDFISVSVSSSSGFNTNLGTLLGAQTSAYLAVCLPGGSGDLLNQIQGVNMSAITGLTSTITAMRIFNATDMQAGVSTALNTLSSLIDQYYYSDLYDFSSTTEKNFMIRVATPSNYACAVNSFSQDNWIPSTRQSDITCSGTTTTASSTQCPNSAAITGGRASSASCFGCMDTVKVLLNAGTVSTDLNARYGGAGACGTWATDMNNLWTNYYLVKKNQLTPIRTRMATAVATGTAAGTGYNAKIAAVGTSFSTIITNLQNVVSIVTNPTYGMVAGMNCLLLGDDINLVQNTLCTTFFNTFYFLRLTLGLAAFGILFTMFCSTCSGVRAFKHSQRVGSILPKELSMNQQQSTMAALHSKN